MENKQKIISSKTITTIKIFLTFITGILIISCSKFNKINSHMIAVSENGYGVLVTNIIQHNTPEVPNYETTDSIYVKSSIPGEHNITTSLRSSKHISQSELSNYITFEYQFMVLSGCSNTYNSKVVKLIFKKDYPPLEIGNIRELSQEKADFYIKKGKGQIATLASTSSEENNEVELLKQYEQELKTSKLYKINIGCKTWTAIDSLKFTKTIDLRPYKEAKEVTRLGKRNKNASGSY